MTSVQTVLGPMDPSQLGLVLMHEHVVFGLTGFELDSCWPVDWSSVRDTAVDHLCALKRAGVQTIVDATTIGMGRNPELLADVSQSSGVNIIASTGLWSRGIPLCFNEHTAQDLAELFILEITQGIQGTGVRPGIIKAASGGDAIKPVARRTLEAAGIAAKETGVPIITHTDGRCGDEQMEIFASFGVPASKVVIGHSCCNADLSYHHKLFATGAFVGFDRIGLEGDEYQDDEIRLACLAALVTAGYAGQIVLSTDCIMQYLGRPSTYNGTQARLPLPLFHDFIPKLKERRITDREIEQMLVENPRRLFES